MTQLFFINILTMKKRKMLATKLEKIFFILAIALQLSLIVIMILQRSP